MITRNELPNVLFFDIETELNINVSEIKVQSLILEKFKININEIDVNKLKYYAEFSKIKSITIGKIIYDGENEKYKKFIKTFKNDSEKETIKEFLNICKKQLETKNKIIFGGHNIEKVGIPFTVKRLILNDLNVPLYLDFTSYKTWNDTIFDILKIWDLMGFSQTSLDLMYHTLFNKDVTNKMDAILDITEHFITKYNG